MDAKNDINWSNYLVKGKKSLKVKFHELTHVVKELRYGLILNGKTITDFKNEILTKDKYTIEEMISILTHYPCGLKED